MAGHLSQGIDLLRDFFIMISLIHFELDNKLHTQRVDGLVEHFRREHDHFSYFSFFSSLIMPTQSLFKCTEPQKKKT